MPRRVRFVIGDQSFPARLHDTPAAERLWEALPLQAAYSTWGDEIYFSTGLQLGAGDRETVELGDVGYWPPGTALCLFYGPTPMSGPGEIRPASEVLVLGRLEGDPEALKHVSARSIQVERLDD